MSEKDSEKDSEKESEKEKETMQGNSRVKFRVTSGGLRISTAAAQFARLRSVDTGAFAFPALSRARGGPSSSSSCACAHRAVYTQGVGHEPRRPTGHGSPLAWPPHTGPGRRRARSIGARTPNPAASRAFAAVSASPTRLAPLPGFEISVDGLGGGVPSTGKRKQLFGGSSVMGSDSFNRPRDPVLDPAAVSRGREIAEQISALDERIESALGVQRKEAEARKHALLTELKRNPEVPSAKTALMYCLL